MSPTTAHLRPSPSALLWPLAFPVAVYAGTELYLLAGNVLYPHGLSTYVSLLALFWGALACLWEVVALPICAYQLARNPALRTRVNLLALCLALAYIVAAGLVALELSSAMKRTPSTHSAYDAQPFAAADLLRLASPACAGG